MNSSMDGAIKKALGNLPAEAGGECPDENAMGAYIEGLLVGDPLLRLQSHLASCSTCRSILALSIQLVEDGQTEVLPAVPKTGSRRVVFHVSIPISVVAMLLVAIGAGILFYRLRSESKIASPVSETASIRIADKPQEAGPLRQGPSNEISTPEPPRMKAAKPAAVSTKAVSDEAGAGISPAPPAVPQPADLRATFQPKPAAEPRAEAEPERLPAVAEVPGPAKEEKVTFMAADLSKDQAPAEGGSRRLLANQTASAPSAMVAAGSGAAKGVVGGAVGGVQGFAQRDPDPRSILLNYGRAAKREGVRFSSAEVDQRVFVEYGAYWIDANIRGHIQEQIIEARKDSEEAREITLGIAGLEKLLSPGRAVFVYWREKVYLIR